MPEDTSAAPPGEADSGTATSRALREHAAGGLQRRAHPAPPDSETERLVASMPVRPTGWFIIMI